MDEFEFDRFVEGAFNWLLSQQEELKETYDIGTGYYDGYWYEQYDGYLQFKIQEVVQIEFPIIFIGSRNSQLETFMWSWANESIIPERREEGFPIKDLAEITGNQLFIEGKPFQCDSQLAWQIAAVTARHLGAIGVYRATEGNSLEIYLAMMEFDEFE